MHMPCERRAHAMHMPYTCLQQALEHDHRLACARGAEDDVRRAAVALRHHILHRLALQSVELWLDRRDGGGAGGGGSGGVGGGGQQVRLSRQERHDVREELGELHNLLRRDRTLRALCVLVPDVALLRLVQRAQLLLSLDPHMLHAEHVTHELHRRSVEGEAEVAVAQVRPVLLACRVGAGRVSAQAVVAPRHRKATPGVEKRLEDVWPAVPEELGAHLAQRGFVSTHDEGRAVDNVDHSQFDLARVKGG